MRAALGAATLAAASSPLATLLPWRSSASAAFRTTRRAESMARRHSATSRTKLPCCAIIFPNTLRSPARAAISSIARSADPRRRMQWCSLPGPRRPWAISKPRPSPQITAEAGTCTLVNSTSACPWGASSYPNTGSARTTCTPGASMGTRTIDCCMCAGAEGAVFPMKMATLQRGSIAPLVHHLRPVIRYPPGAGSMRLWIFVASLDAPAGSVIAKQLRISPRRSGSSHLRFCSEVP
mmetsp:Transcript_55179/g.175543  ORF Transcript_55179/g.175543 Transcript_55179/m.175543 type:complete len:237 (-) Transcript_55179:408-1118(-)